MNPSDQEANQADVLDFDSDVPHPIPSYSAQLAASAVATARGYLIEAGQLYNSSDDRERECAPALVELALISIDAANDVLPGLAADVNHMLTIHADAAGLAVEQPDEAPTCPSCGSGDTGADYCPDCGLSVPPFPAPADVDVDQAVGRVEHNGTDHTARCQATTAEGRQCELPADHMFIYRLADEVAPTPRSQPHQVTDERTGHPRRWR